MTSESILAPNPSVKVPCGPLTLWTVDADFMATVKPLRSLPSTHGIELVFFLHGGRIEGLTLQNLNCKDSTAVNFF